MKRIILLLIVVFTTSSCYKVEVDSADEIRERGMLDLMLYELIQISESGECSDETNWSYTDYGAKSCGGPVGYIPYSLDIDVADFLAKVEKHRQAEMKFNEKWGIVSDCSIPPLPVGLICEKNTARLLY